MNPLLAETLFVATVAFYVVCGVSFVGALAGWSFAAAGTRAARLTPWVLAAGTTLHAAHIVVASLVLRVCPVEGMHFSLSVLSMFACVAFLVARLRFRIDVLGAFVVPLALTFITASRFVAAEASPSSQMKSTILPLHVTANLLGDGLFALAFAAATLYLVQERHLKQKNFGGVFRRLPPLDALDRAEHKFLLAGFPLLTLGILTGTIWAGRVERGSGADLARAGFGYATWLLFAGVLLLRAAAGWRGRRAAYGTIAGFGFAVLVLILYLIRSYNAVPTPMALLGNALDGLP